MEDVPSLLSSPPITRGELARRLFCTAKFTQQAILTIVVCAGVHLLCGWLNYTQFGQFPFPLANDSTAFACLERIDKRPSHGVNLITEVLADALLTAFFVSGGQLAPRIKDVQHGRLPLVAADAFPTGCCCMTLLFPPCRKRGGSAATRHDHAHNVASWLSLTFVWGVGWGGLTLAGLEVLRVAAYDAYSPLCLAPWPYLAARAVWTAIEALLVVAGSYALWCTRGEADERSLPLDCAGHQSPYHVQHGTSGLAAGKPIAAIRSPFLQAVSPTATGFVAVD